RFDLEEVGQWQQSGKNLFLKSNLFYRRLLNFLLFIFFWNALLCSNISALVSSKLFPYNEAYSLAIMPTMVLESHNLRKLCMRFSKSIGSKRMRFRSIK